MNFKIMKKKLFGFLLLLVLMLPGAPVDAASCASLGNPTDCGSGDTVGYSCLNFGSGSHPDLYDIKPCHCGAVDTIKCAKEKVAARTTGLEGCTGADEVKIFGTCVVTNSLDGMMGLGLAATKFMLGMVGSIALLAFVWGGFQMILAAGDLSKVKKGKDSIVAAVIGLVIVFTSYILVQFVMENLLGVVSK